MFWHGHSESEYPTRNSERRSEERQVHILLPPNHGGFLLDILRFKAVFVIRTVRGYPNSGNSRLLVNMGRP